MSKTFTVWRFGESANDLKNLLSKGIKDVKCDYDEKGRIVVYYDFKLWNAVKKIFKVSDFDGRPDYLEQLLYDGLSMVRCKLNSRGGITVHYGLEDEVHERVRDMPRSSPQKEEEKDSHEHEGSLKVKLAKAKIKSAEPIEEARQRDMQTALSSYQHRKRERDDLDR